jgi:hypothetical protein
MVPNLAASRPAPTLAIMFGTMPHGFDGVCPFRILEDRGVNYRQGFIFFSRNNPVIFETSFGLLDTERETADQRSMEEKVICCKYAVESS